YFSDQNSWWPYFRYWSDYNARLSALFLFFIPVVDVGIMTPEADIWTEWGLYRAPFHMEPWFNHDLWEAFSNAGVSADYINEGVIRRAIANDGEMKSESASYKLIIIPAASSILPETASAIETLTREGVQFLFLDHLPSSTPSYSEKEKGDQLVQKMMSSTSSYDHTRLMEGPVKGESMSDWTATMLKETGLESSVDLTPVNEKLYLLKHYSGSSEIYFFSNQDELNEIVCTANFESKGKTAWCWDPHTGDRFIYPVKKKSTVEIRLQPLESLLLVLEEKGAGQAAELTFPNEISGETIGDTWNLKFHPTVGEPFETSTGELFQFGSHQDTRIATFAGQVVYSTSFSSGQTDWAFLDLGIEQHITEARINGKELGVKWWGRHLYRIPEGVLKQGENQLQITYTTTLANYANSLTSNQAAKKWINLKKPDPMGLKGDIRLLKRN
ncbi:MAG: hypothetical protein GY790_16325, partial [Bacteroidetes bacterium]|nr:hypothetical protein [Bacteroidota bacterium]